MWLEKRRDSSDLIDTFKIMYAIYIYDVNREIFCEAKAFIHGASDDQISLVTEWVSDWVHSFSPWDSSAMATATETKFSTKVA